jgi:hypothetical protein
MFKTIQEYLKEADTWNHGGSSGGVYSPAVVDENYTR